MQLDKQAWVPELPTALSQESSVCQKVGCSCPAPGILRAMLGSDSSALLRGGQAGTLTPPEFWVFTPHDQAALQRFLPAPGLLSG